ncbi:hypothetical protein IMAU10062_01471 [Lactiplantibacillus plantarum]|nr:hypothetical protein [Lactiplantibacillus plantarum]
MDDDFAYADACMTQAYSNDKAEELFGLSDEDFLDYIIENGIDCDYVIKGFKAWTIAKRIKRNGWHPTLKQRTAITNVYCFTLYGVKPSWSIS